MIPSFFLKNLLFIHGHTIIGFIIIILGCSIILKKPFIALCACAFFAFSLFTFRSPVRTCIPARTNPYAIICPADGTVIACEPTKRPDYRYTISLFISPFDAHVMWMPFSGTIEKIAYTPGAFMPAFFIPSTFCNESNEITVATKHGSLIIRQVAGFIFRRICCWVHVNDIVQAGTIYGMIRFGSRVDIFLPPQTKPAVGIGQHVSGGQTVLAYWTP